MIKVVILASGSGSNTENIINYFSDNKEIRIDSIISNKADAYVHKRAELLGVKSYTFSKEEFINSEKIINFLEEKGIDFIILAGFLLKISPEIVKKYPNRIINIHPALLPKYGGKGMYGNYVHQAVANAQEKETGITIHYVNENYDEGNIIFQAKCCVLSIDSPDDIASKVHKLEYQYFPKVIEETIYKNIPIR